MGAPSGSFFSSADDSPSPFDFAKDSSESKKQQKQQQFRVNDDNHYLAFSLYRWYSSLSLKLSWLQSSHKTVIDNLLLFQRIPRTWPLSTRQWNAYTDLNLICIRPKDCLTWYLFVFQNLDVNVCWYGNSVWNVFHLPSSVHISKILLMECFVILISTSFIPFFFGNLTCEYSVCLRTRISASLVVCTEMIFYINFNVWCCCLVFHFNLRVSIELNKFLFSSLSLEIFPRRRWISLFLLLSQLEALRYYYWHSVTLRDVCVVMWLRSRLRCLFWKTMRET